MKYITLVLILTLLSGCNGPDDSTMYHDKYYTCWYDNTSPYQTDDYPGTNAYCRINTTWVITCYFDGGIRGKPPQSCFE